MTKDLKISIVTPSFNQGDYLEETIESVLSQNHPNFEYVIIDGGSTDNSVEIIKKYEKHLRYWVSEPDKGQSHAINKGLKHVTGDIFNWLNSDDYYEPDTFQRINYYFQEKQISCLCGRSNIFNESGILKKSSGTDLYEGNLAKTIGWARIDQPETFFKMSAVQKMEPLNQHLRYVMDREWWIRYLLLFGLEGIIKTDDILVNFRLHQDSKTVSESERFFDESYQLWSELTEIAGLQELTGSFRLHSKKKEKVLYKHLYKNIENHDIIRPAVQYALLYLADYFYFIGNTNESKNILSFIDLSCIEQDKQLFNTLKWRSSFPLLKKVANYFRGS